MFLFKGGQNSIFWCYRNRVLTNKRNIPFYPTSIGLFVPKISPVKVNIPQKQSRDKIKTILTFRVPMTSWTCLHFVLLSDFYVTFYEQKWRKWNSHRLLCDVMKSALQFLLLSDLVTFYGQKWRKWNSHRLPCDVIGSEDFNSVLDCWYFWILKRQENAVFNRNYLKNEMTIWNGVKTSVFF